jgi:hypothetical protein
MIGLPGIMLGTLVMPPCTSCNGAGRILLLCCFGLDTDSAIDLDGWCPWAPSSHASVAHE